jgi:pimeloyl-ACP methyl ester carboxylesterase
MKMIEEKKISIENLEVNYKIAGEGFPFLILHGWGGSSNSWTYVQKRLAGKGYKVISPDLPGFGKSVSPAIPWEIKDYSNFVLNFIERLKLEKLILLGHSFGGRISIKLASLHPDKFKFLILCDSAGIKRKLNFRQRMIFYFAQFGNFLFSKKLLRRFKDMAKNIFYIAIRQRDYTKVKGAMRETFKKVVDEDLLPDLSKISTKTLIIWGGKDKAVPLEDAYLIKEKIINSTLEIVPGVGHTLNLEAPEKLATIILDFLKNKN